MKLIRHQALLFFLFLHVSAFSQNEFVTRWLVPSSQDSMAIDVSTSASTGFTWETVPSGQSGSGSLSSGSTRHVITGLPPGATIRLRISPITLQAFSPSTNYEGALLDVQQWGDVVWTDMTNMFKGCFNLNITATDIPNLTNVNSLEGTFSGCSVLDGPANIGDWDVSNVENMSHLFYYARGFNQDVSGWNTQNVTDMSFLFYEARSFDQPLWPWNTQNVTDMSYMFRMASNFNQPIATWNTSNVTTMKGMFQSIPSFNKPIGLWVVDSVSDFSMMFQFSAYNQPLNNWNVGAGTTFNSMFYGNGSFDQPIGNWNLQSATDLHAMFRDAGNFNQPVGNWDISHVTDISEIFWDASTFNQPIGGWNTFSVSNFSSAFRDAYNFNQDISAWNTTNGTDFSYMFKNAADFNQDLSSWNTSSVLQMENMFSGAINFNQSLGTWNLGGLSNHNSMVNMLWMAALDCDNYSQTLIGWKNNSQTPDSIQLGTCPGFRYDNYAANARDSLITVKKWTIFGDSLGCLQPISTAPVVLKPAITLHPNPAENLVFFNNETTLEVEVYDLMGNRLLVKKCLPHGSIDVSHLASGWYLVRYKNGGSTPFVKR